MWRTLEDLTGRQFGRLTVIERDEDYIYPKSGKHAPKWLCECSCGRQKSIMAKSLTSGGTTSCGCYNREISATPEAAQRNKANALKHGGRGTRLYNIWKGIKKRCNNQAATNYAFYGGRGIRVCTEWETDFVAFRDWALTHGEL